MLVELYCAHVGGEGLVGLYSEELHCAQALVVWQGLALAQSWDGQQ